MIKSHEIDMKHSVDLVHSNENRLNHTDNRESHGG